MTPADPAFDHPRLAAVYDALDPDRSDLDVYVGLVAELGAHRVLDVGCGTGTLALLLAERGLDVVGLDPATASLAVARSKPGADRVGWIEGDATSAVALDPRVDLAVMTGNVAQVFLTDQEWASTLTALRRVVRTGGHLVLETRRPEQQAWRGWNRAETHAHTRLDDGEVVETWCDLLTVELPHVTFRRTYVFSSDGAVLESHSTLRFRERSEVESALGQAGFEVSEVRDAPDRPGHEMVFVARRG